MPRFEANIRWMFKEFDMPERFVQAARCGFKGVEHGGSLRLEGEGRCPVAEGQRPGDGADPDAAGLGGRRARAGEPARPRGRFPGGGEARHRLRGRGRDEDAASRDRRDAEGRGAREDLGTLRREPGLRLRRGEEGGADPADRAGVQRTVSGVLHPYARRRHPAHQGRRPRQSQALLRHLPCADGGGRAQRQPRAELAVDRSSCSSAIRRGGTSPASAS